MSANECEKKEEIGEVLLYGCETWVMGRRDRDRIEHFEILVWKRIGKIKWIDRMGNEEILIKLKENGTLLSTIRKRKGNE